MARKGGGRGGKTRLKARPAIKFDCRSAPHPLVWLNRLAQSTVFEDYIAKIRRISVGYKALEHLIQVRA